MFFFLSQAWNKEKILSPHEKSNLTTSASILQCSAPELQRLYGEQSPFMKFLFSVVFHILQKNAFTL